MNHSLSLSLSPASASDRAEQGSRFQPEDRRGSGDGGQAGSGEAATEGDAAGQGRAGIQQSREADHRLEWAGPHTVVHHGNQSHTHNRREWS